MGLMKLANPWSLGAINPNSLGCVVPSVEAQFAPVEEQLVVPNGLKQGAEMSGSSSANPTPENVTNSAKPSNNCRCFIFIATPSLERLMIGY